VANETALLSLVDAFIARVASLVPSGRFSWTVSDLNKNPNWPTEWSDHQGVYYCVRGNDGAVVYVGKSSPGYLGSRVWNLINPAYSNVPDSILNDPGTRVGIIVFDDADWYWALSLEAHLIRELQPTFCKGFR